MLARIPITPGEALVSHTFTVAQRSFERGLRSGRGHAGQAEASSATSRCRGRGIALILANSSRGCATL